MFLSNLKKTFEDTKALHRFIYENTPFYESPNGKYPKDYNLLQAEVLKRIAALKFGGDIQKFISSPSAKTVMETYRDFISAEMPFLLASSDPSFNPKDDVVINKILQFILNKVYPAAKQMAMGSWK
jgi:hypothetical protein